MLNMLLLAAVLQCPPMANPILGDKITFDGMTYTTHDINTDTKTQDIEHVTNLPSHTNIVTLQGSVTTTNTSAYNIIRYEFRVRIPASSLRSPVVTELRNFCYQEDEDAYVIYSTQELLPGRTATFELDGAIILGPNPYDLNDDGTVNGADLGILFMGWGMPGIADFDNNGVVDGADLAQLLIYWR